MQGRIARADLEEGQQDFDAVFPHMSHDISAEILVGLAEQAGHLTVHGHGAQRGLPGTGGPDGQRRAQAGMIGAKQEDRARQAHMGQGGADNPAAVDVPGMGEHEARQMGRIPGGKGRSGQGRPLFQERLHFGAQVGRDISIKTACDSGLTKMHGGILPKKILNWKEHSAGGGQRPARPEQLSRRKRAGEGRWRGRACKAVSAAFPKRTFRLRDVGAPRPSGFGDAGIKRA